MTRATRLASLACLVLLNAITTGQTTAPASTPAALTPSTALAKRLATTLPAVKLDRAPLHDVIERLRASSRATIHVDWRALGKVDMKPDTLVTLNQPAAPLGEMLDAVLARLAAGKSAWLASGNLVWITSKDAAPQLADRLRVWDQRRVNDPVAREMLGKRLPEVRIDSVPAADVVDFLRDVTTADIIVEWKALQTAGVKRNIPLSLRTGEVTLSEALFLFIESIQPETPIDITAKDGVITIAPAKRDSV